MRLEMGEDEEGVRLQVHPICETAHIHFGVEKEEVKLVLLRALGQSRVQ